MVWMLLALHIAAEPAALPPPQPPANSLARPIAAFAAAAAADWATTYYGQSSGRTRETNPLIRRLQSRPAAMIATGAGIDVGMVLAVRAIGKHHPRMAKIYLYAASGVRVTLAVRNLHAIHISR